MNCSFHYHIRRYGKSTQNFCMQILSELSCMETACCSGPILRYQILALIFSHPCKPVSHRVCQNRHCRKMFPNFHSHILPCLSIPSCPCIHECLQWPEQRKNFIWKTFLPY